MFNCKGKQWHPTPVLLPEESHGQRSLEGCSPWHHWGSDTNERLHFHFHFHALEKEMATHSSVLAWRIPGTGKPGGLPSMGSHRAGHVLQWLSSSSKGKRTVGKANKGINVEKKIINFKKLKRKKIKLKIKGKFHRTAKAQHSVMFITTIKNVNEEKN